MAGKSEGRETIYRQWLMLRLIPRHPRKISTSELSQALRSKGYEITQRSIQRDLNALSGLFPLVVDDRNRPFGWSWAADASGMDIPTLDSHVAITYNLVEQYLKPLLPPTIHKHMKPQFKAAQSVLDSNHDPRSVFHWRNKIRVVHRAPRLLSPSVDDTVQKLIYEALLHNRKFSVAYQSRQSAEKKNYKVNPLALVLKEGLLYLVCTMNDYNDIRLLVPQRMSEGNMLDEPSNIPDTFDLDTYLQDEALRFSESAHITFKAMFRRDAAFHLSERALSEDQQLEIQKDGRTYVCATVSDSIEFRWWLLGFGEKLEVLEPIEIRQWIIQTVAHMQALYSEKEDDVNKGY